MGGVGEEGGVGAAGVGDEDGAQVAECLVEESGFRGEIHHVILVGWQAESKRSRYRAIPAFMAAQGL